MNSPSFRDLQNLSAYLDGQLSSSKSKRLEVRLQSDPALAAALEDLRQTRTLIRSIPRRRAPRTFTLTPRMAGIKPPVPRLVPALSWASAAAMLLFIFTLGTSLVGRLSFGAAAPRLAAAPSGMGAPQAAAPAPFNAAEAATPANPPSPTQAPALAAPALPATAAPATEAPAIASPPPAAPAPLRSDQTALATATAEAAAKQAPLITPSGPAVVVPPPQTSSAKQKPFDLWLLIWPALGVLLGLAALLIYWQNRRTFTRKNPPK